MVGEEGRSDDVRLGGAERYDVSRGSGLIRRHGVIIALLAVAGLVPILTAGGGGGIERIQVANSAWTGPAVWNAEAAPPSGAAVQATLRELEARANTRDPSLAAAVVATDAPTPEAVVTPVPTPTPEPWGTMEIREGDTLSDLAYWFGLYPGDIARANGMALGEYVLVGQTIVIPIPESEMVIPPEPVIVVEEPAPVVEEIVPEPEPVATPPPTPQRTPPPPAFAGTTEDVIAAICSFDWDCDKMVSIAMCESGLNPTAYNPAGYYGLFQINYEFPGWDDPYTNAKVAYEQKYLPYVQQGGEGTEPWPYCRNY